MAPDRRRVAPETYWAIRRSSQNVRCYMSMHYPGKKDRTYQDLWLTAEMIDLEVDRAYQWGGLPGLQHALATSDSLEHMLSRIGAEIALHRTGDARMFADLLTSKPPGDSDILPTWALNAACDVSKALHQQASRVRGGGRRAEPDSDDEPGGGGTKKRKRKKPKAKAMSAVAVGGNLKQD